MNFNALRALLVFMFCSCSDSRRHRVTIRDDEREIITCTTFGFLQHSYLKVQMEDFHIPSVQPDPYSFGFTLDKKDSAGASSYFDSRRLYKCILRDEIAASQAAEIGENKLSSAPDRSQGSFVLLRFDFQNPTDGYKMSRIVLTTNGNDDLGKLSFFSIPEGEYNDWMLDPLRIPPTFQLSHSESRYAVYTVMWKRFFDSHMPQLMQQVQQSPQNKQANSKTAASRQCTKQIVNRAINGSLGSLFAAILADTKAKSDATYSYLPLVREYSAIDVAGEKTKANRLSNAGTIKSGKIGGQSADASASASSPLGNLEDFSSWFFRVLEQLRTTLGMATNNKKQPLLKYQFGGVSLSVSDLTQLTSCVAAAIDHDDHASLVSFGDPAAADFQAAVYEAFRVRAVNGTLPLTYDSEKDVFGAKFVMAIDQPEQEGLYTMYFHNCPPRDSAGGIAQQRPISFTLAVVEKNPSTFLSATQSALPLLNFSFAAIYTVLSVIWAGVLCRPHTRTAVYKIHYVMLLLLVLKTLAFLFHGINFLVIGRTGRHEEAWAVMYYVTHLVKGALLFMTVALIGAGWAFVKHVLSERDKKILIIVIPLQIVANVAKIIIEESEESMQSYTMLKELLTLLDLVCCGAILFPIVWSIRHLQQAAQTDGKAAMNLEKLRLFQQFYILVVCYIYFTRIMAYLIRITVSFRYDWTDELFAELTTLIFFVVSGYKFRPASNNPYLAVPVDELEMDEVADAVTPSGAFDGVQKTMRGRLRHATRDRESQQQRRDADDAQRQLLAQARLDAEADDDDVVWDTRIMHETTVSSNQRHKMLHNDENYE